MAGIGFELRKLLKTQTFSGLLRSYGYAGVISSGPWVLSILVIMLLGLYSLGPFHAVNRGVGEFLISVTNLIAASLILTGFVQLLFTRFVADRLYENRRDTVLPNLIGLLIIVNVVAGLVGCGLLLWLFRATPLSYQLEMFTGFMLLCNIWVLTIFLSGMKEYRQILACFAVGYGLVLVLGVYLRSQGLEGLLGAFVVGQSVLCFSMLFLVLRAYPSTRLVAWNLLESVGTHRSLMLTGFVYNLAIWVDKYQFWYNPGTSIPIIGPLRASPLYDFPLFLAYLSIIPGMAVFLVRMETDFAEQYEHYYDAVRQGDTLEHIEHLRDNMTGAVRQGLYEIFKIQGITIVLLLVFGPRILHWLGFSALYIPLFNIDIIGVGLQILLLAILNTMFYLDKRHIALFLCVLFMTGNFLLTMLSQQLGASYYGYGYAVSLLIATLVGLFLLSRTMDRLSYETFMFQPGPGSIA